MTKNVLPLLPYRFKYLNILTDDIKTVDYCYVSTHDYCNIILKTLTEFIDSDKEIPEKLIQRFFRVIGGAIECWSLNYDINIIKSKYIIEHVELNNNLLKELFRTNNNELIQIYLQSHVMTYELLIQLLDIIKCLHIGNDIILDIIFNHAIKINDKKVLDTLFNHVINIKNIDYINKLLDSKFKPSNESFIVLLSYLIFMDDPIDTIKKCVLNGIKIEKEFLKVYVLFIIQNNDQNSIYIKKCKFNEICLYLYENGANEVVITDIIKSTNLLGKINIDLTINNLIDSSYDITKNDFLELCKQKFIIKNIKKIQKYFDDTEIQAAIIDSNLNYPIKINYTIEILRNECKKKNNISKIKQISKNIKPDQECLENACYVSNNNSVIKYLHEDCKIIFNDKCILNFALTLKQNQLLRYVLTKHCSDGNKNNNLNPYVDLDKIVAGNNFDESSESSDLDDN